MPRTDLANERFEKFLRQYDATPDLAQRIRTDLALALGNPSGTSFLNPDIPIVGYYVDWITDAAVLQFSLVTPGRFVKYDLTHDVSLAITIPIERINRLQCRREGRDAVLRIEFEAEHTTTELRALPDANDPSRSPNYAARTRYAHYEITSQPEGTTSFNEFYAALANVLGR